MTATSELLWSMDHSPSTDAVTATTQSSAIYALAPRQFRGAKLKNFHQGRVGFSTEQPEFTWQRYLKSFSEFHNDEHFFSKVLPCQTLRELLQLLFREELDLILISEEMLKSIIRTTPHLMSHLTVISKMI